MLLRNLIPNTTITYLQVLGWDEKWCQHLLDQPYMVMKFVELMNSRHSLVALLAGFVAPLGRTLLVKLLNLYTLPEMQAMVETKITPELSQLDFILNIAKCFRNAINHKLLTAGFLQLFDNKDLLMKLPIGLLSGDTVEFFWRVICCLSYDAFVYLLNKDLFQSLVDGLEDSSLLRTNFKVVITSCKKEDGTYDYDKLELLIRHCSGWRETKRQRLSKTPETVFFAHNQRSDNTLGSQRLDEVIDQCCEMLQKAKQLPPMEKYNQAVQVYHTLANGIRVFKADEINNNSLSEVNPQNGRSM